MLEKMLESPFDSKEIKPVNPKGNQSWILLEGLMLQYFGHLMQSVDSLEKNMMLGKIKGRRRRGWQRIRWLYDITNSRSLLKLMSIESVMPSNHLILCHPLLLLPSIFPSIRSFQMSQLFPSGGSDMAECLPAGEVKVLLGVAFGATLSYQ